MVNPDMTFKICADTRDIEAALCHWTDHLHSVKYIIGHSGIKGAAHQVLTLCLAWHKVPPTLCQGLVVAVSEEIPGLCWDLAGSESSLVSCGGSGSTEEVVLIVGFRAWRFRRAAFWAVLVPQ